MPQQTGPYSLLYLQVTLFCLEHFDKCTYCCWSGKNLMYPWPLHMYILRLEMSHSYNEMSHSYN